MKVQNVCKKYFYGSHNLIVSLLFDCLATSRMKKALFFIWSWLLSILAFAQATPTNDLFIYSLADEWTVYDYSSKIYLPYFKELYSNANKVHLNLQKEEYKGLNLAIEGDSAACLFINNQFCYKFLRKQFSNFSIDSLQKKFATNGILQLTYYQEEPISNPPTTYITLYTYTKPLVAQQVQQEGIQVRNYSLSKNLLGLAGLFAFALVALISSVHFPLFKWSQWGRNFSNFLQARTQIKRLQSSQFIWYMVFYGVTVAFTIVVSSREYTANFIIINTNLLGSELLKFFLLFVLFAFSVVGKYAIIWLMGVLYNNKTLLNLHFQEMMVVSQIITAIILLVSSLVATVTIQLDGAAVFLKYFVVFMFALQTLLMLYRLKESLKYSWVYFFSYVSATELVPFFLYLKLFLSL